MSEPLFTPEDLNQIRDHGLTLELVREQLDRLTRGIPPVQLVRPCTPGDGIHVLRPEERDRLVQVYRQARDRLAMVKFVPASGAATRMFRDLFAARQRLARGDLSASQPEGRTLQQFMAHLDRFAFFPALARALQADGYDIRELRRQQRFDIILDYLLTDRGLNYGHLPKGLIPFHRYRDHARTPVEEHMVEALTYARDRNDIAHLHFTVAPEHRQRFHDHIETTRPRYEQDHARLDVTLSIQDPSTDTLAVDLENRPFRDEHGRLVFRPGGHGALLKNLNDLTADLIFIKNIDNVVPDHLKHETHHSMQALAGLLLEIQDRVFAFLTRLERGDVDAALRQDLERFARDMFFFQDPAPSESGTAWIEFWYDRLHRPLRICGVVPNVGDPGGGPFWVRMRDGSVTMQIVETAQIDRNDPEQRTILKASTHFNPVFIVAARRDHRGRLFDLFRYRDPDAGIITIKSRDGRDLKALEHPGLWNGGMAYWLTVFVEIPRITFNPVKTVLDLLRPEHQPPADA